MTEGGGRAPFPRLLYVEDDVDIAEMTVEVLSGAYRIDQAVDGQQGLVRALRDRYDVMVIDCRLPRLDGIALVRAVRRAHITTPILLLTALGTTAEHVEGLDAGANDYLVKPYEFTELAARLRALCRGFREQTGRREIGEWLFIPDTGVLLSPVGLRVTLTHTEARLLELLSDSPQHVFSRTEIVRAVFAAADAAGRSGVRPAAGAVTAS